MDCLAWHFEVYGWKCDDQEVLLALENVRGKCANACVEMLVREAWLLGIMGNLKGLCVPHKGR